MADETLNVLKKAREKISKRWAKGSLLKPGGSVCMIGALGMTLAEEELIPKETKTQKAANGSGDSWYQNDRVKCLAALLSSNLPSIYKRTGGNRPVDEIVGFNDDDKTAKDEILAVFDKTIAQYEKEHADA